MKEQIYVAFGDENIEELMCQISGTQISLKVLETDHLGCTFELTGPEEEVNEILENFSYE